MNERRQLATDSSEVSRGCLASWLYANSQGQGPRPGSGEVGGRSGLKDLAEPEKSHLELVSWQGCQRPLLPGPEHTEDHPVVTPEAWVRRGGPFFLPEASLLHGEVSLGLLQ